MLKGYQKKELKKLAHHLKPSAMVGQQGITDNLIDLINEALDVHELIKIKFTAYKELKKKITVDIVEKAECQLVDIIGHTAILYRQNKDEEKRKIKLPVRAEEE